MKVISHVISISKLIVFPLVLDWCENEAKMKEVERQLMQLLVEKSDLERKAELKQHHLSAPARHAIEEWWVKNRDKYMTLTAKLSEHQAKKATSKQYYTTN